MTFIILYRELKKIFDCLRGNLNVRNIFSQLIFCTLEHFDLRISKNYPERHRSAIAF